MMQPANQPRMNKTPKMGGSGDGDVLVRVEGLSKKFCRSLKQSLWYGMKDMAQEFNPFGGERGEASGALRPGEFWAVKDVSFELRRGDCLGLLGHNGAGKTTLLKMLNGLIKPDAGTIAMRGRVGAIIALGAGFNPILTGRENVYVNGSVLGLTREEIDGKLEEIVDFADLRDAIDAPVQSYSSGMQVRLGFAVATSLEPDVLLLDEVLSVGDIGFRVRSYNRIARLLPRTAVIFVSHNQVDIGRICTELMVLNRGEVYRKTKGIAEGIGAYNSLVSASESGTDEFGSEVLRVVGFERQGVGGGGEDRAEMRVISSEDHGPLQLMIYLFEEGSEIAVQVAFEEAIEVGSGEQTFEVGFALPPLRGGKYQMDIVFARRCEGVADVFVARSRSVYAWQVAKGEAFEPAVCNVSGRVRMKVAAGAGN